MTPRPTPPPARSSPPPPLELDLELAVRKRSRPEAERLAEQGGPAGLEPTRFGDWERKGIAVDF